MPRSLVRLEDEAGRDWEGRCSPDDAGSHGIAPGLREKCGLMLARESGSFKRCANTFKYKFGNFVRVCMVGAQRSLDRSSARAQLIGNDTAAGRSMRI